MGVLRLSVRKGRYYREEAVHGVQREPAGRGRRHDGREARGHQRDDALDAGVEPDDTGPAQARLGGHAHERQGQAVEGVRRIDDLDRVNGEVGEPDRGSVLDAF
jgi:hypothetical protein